MISIEDFFSCSSEIRQYSFVKLSVLFRQQGHNNNNNKMIISCDSLRVKRKQQLYEVSLLYKV